MEINKFKKIIFILIIFSFMFFGVDFVKAENLNVILTWNTNNFYPSDYNCKPWVTKNNEISVSAVILKNNKIINDSDVKFNWFVNGKYFDSGLEKNTIKIVTDDYNVFDYSITLKIKIGGQDIEKRLNIPIKKYDVVINKKIPYKNIYLGQNINLKLIPYFFNVNNFNDLNFSWNIVNNNNYSKNGNILNLEIKNNKTLINNNIFITGWVYNKLNPLENSRSNITLKINE